MKGRFPGTSAQNLPVRCPPQLRRRTLCAGAVEANALAANVAPFADLAKATAEVCISIDFRSSIVGGSRIGEDQGNRVYSSQHPSVHAVGKHENRHLIDFEFLRQILVE